MFENIEQSEIKIRKVKIHNDHCLTIEFLKSNGSGADDEYLAKQYHSMHADLEVIWKKLSVHLALATEYVTGPLIKLNKIAEPYDTQADHDLFSPFECRSYSRNWSEAREGIVISGVRRLKSKRVVSINSPFMETDPTLCGYDYIELLLNIINQFEQEVYLYLVGQKFTEKQLELVENEEVAE